MSLDRRTFETFIDKVRENERADAFDLLLETEAELNELVGCLVMLSGYLLNIYGGRNPEDKHGFLCLQPLPGSQITLPVQVAVASANDDADMVNALTSTIRNEEEAHRFTYDMLRLSLELINKVGLPPGWGVHDE